MAIVLDDRPVQQDGGVKPRRGGFMRDRKGVAHITCPNGTLVKTGPRAGQPLRIRYASPSGIGDQIENRTNLEKWAQRKEAIGFALHPQLVDDVQRLIDGPIDPDSREFKDRLDGIIAEGLRVAKAHLAADQGSHAHAITEDDDEGRNWLDRALEGEELGMPEGVQALLVEAWRRLLVREGLIVLASEFPCVNDAWKAAGTGDNHFETTKPLAFEVVDPAGGTRTVTVPAGIVVVGDKKTGKLKRHHRHRGLQYAQGFGPQIACYAMSRPYDLATETRGEWPYEVSQDHALLVHIDVAAALAGETDPDCLAELIYVDLAEGRRIGELCLLAKKFDAMNTTKPSTTFSVGRAPVDGQECPHDGGADPKSEAPVGAAVDPPTAAEQIIEAFPGSAIEPVDQKAFNADRYRALPEDLQRQFVDSRVDVNDHAATDAVLTELERTARRNQLRARYESFNVDEQREFVALEVDMNDLDAVAEAIETVDGFNLRIEPVPYTPHIPPAGAPLPEKPAPPAPEPLLEPAIEGEDMDSADWAAAGTAFAALTYEQKAWMEHLVAEAAAAGLYMSGMGGRYSARRFHLLTGLLSLARFGADDDVARIAVATVLDSDIPLEVPAGGAVGALDWSDALRFSNVAEQYVDGTLGVVFDEAGSPRFRPSKGTKTA